MVFPSLSILSLYYLCNIKVLLLYGIIIGIRSQFFNVGFALIPPVISLKSSSYLFVIKQEDMYFFLRKS